MMTILNCCSILLFLLLLTTRKGSCNKNCYACHSTDSMEDCESKQRKEMGCSHISNETSMCYVIEQTRHDGRKSFGKQCISGRYCKKEKACHPQSIECKIYCCTEPLCNGARVLAPGTSTPELVMAKKLIKLITRQKVKRAFRKMIFLENRPNRLGKNLNLWRQ